MRFHTEISARRSTPADVNLVMFPNSGVEPEVNIAFGGLGVWLSANEAEALSDQLALAVSRIRESSSTGETNA